MMTRWSYQDVVETLSAELVSASAAKAVLKWEVGSMRVQARHSQRGRRLWTQWYVVVAGFIAIACHQNVPIGEHARARDGGVKAEDVVNVSVVDADLVVQYRTKTSIRDCEAHAVEMPQVWKLVVRPRLEKGALQRVFLSAAEASGRSVAMTFTKRASGEWTAVAPCVIRIPID
jgi:hypothetical protein